MPADPSSRPRRRHHSSRHTSHSRSKIPDSPSISSEEETADSIDVERIRRSRDEFYNKTPEERTRDYHKNSMPRQGHDEERSHRKRRTHKSSAAVGTTRTSTSDTHHRRRRRSKEKERVADTDAEYVYKQQTVVAEEGVEKPRANSSGKRSSAPLGRPKVERVEADHLPAKYQKVRPKLAHPSRASSQRASRPKVEDDMRRHSYHESTTRRTASISRSSSLREGNPKATSRPSLSRSQTSATKSRKTTPTMPVVQEETAKSQTGTKLGRSNSAFGSLFGPHRSSKPEAKVTCLTCMDDDVPASRSAKLACSHRMCHACLKRVFTMSVNDPAHMPPKCCTQDCIPLKHVDKLFDDRFKLRWNRKYQEFTTENRIYCPAKGCGTWIPPKNIHTDTVTRKKGGRCSRCKTKVCVKCNGKWHGDKPCSTDEETNAFQDMAKEAGWQRCYNCSAMVELKEGCNHMTCRCTAEFCMICGVKWKGCDCPWFNYATVANDRLEHMNVAEVRREPARAEQPRGYEEELRQRREQEQQDEEVARRLQHLDIDATLAPRWARRAERSQHDPAVDDFLQRAEAYRNIVRESQTDNEFARRATRILTGRYDPAAEQAADRLVNEIRIGQRAADLGSLDAMAPDPTMDQGLGRAATMARRNAAARRAVRGEPGAGREAPAPAPRYNPFDYMETGPFGLVMEDPGRFDPAAVRQAPASGEPSAATQAGMERMSNTGRVDAWRRHVSIE